MIDMRLSSFAFLAICFSCTSTPTFEDRLPTGGVECSTMGEPGLCPGGEVCLNGRCFAECMVGGCSTGEQCQAGVCIPTGMTPDGGPNFDANISRPCNNACTADEVCDLVRDECVGCVTGDDCNGDTPVCDLATDACVSRSTAVCGPCSADSDCAGDATCVTRDSRNERVCMEPCTPGATMDDPPTCPSGYDCSADICVPLGTCTQLYRGLTGTMCDPMAEPVGLECVPRGSSGTAEGTCSAAGLCRVACGETGCPVAVPALRCGSDEFCTSVMAR